MTIAEAKRIEREFYRKPKPTEDDIFLFTEAMDYNRIHKRSAGNDVSRRLFL